MSVNSEIADLEANLAAAKAIVVRKGGTVSDTGLAGLAQEITDIPYGPVLVTGVEITSPASPATMIKGEPDVVLSADILPVDATDKTVSWSSSDTDVVSVSQDVQTGDWTAHPIISGNATLTVTTTDGGLTDSVSVSVTESWGTISYYDFSQGWNKETAARCTINSVDTVRLQDYLDSVEHSDEEEVWFQYNKNDKVWRDRNVSPTVDILPENLESTTGINVTISDPELSANFRLRKKYIIDTTSQPTRKSITQSEYESLNTNIYNISGLNIPCTAVYSFVFTSTPTTTPAGFLSGCSNLEVLDMSGATGLTSIQNNFLASCSLFNQEFTIPANVTTIGNYFLANCPSFNQLLIIPDNVTSIGDNFLFGCSSFNQPITIPNDVTSVGGSFLNNCNNFNSSVTLSSSLTTINEGFLRNCQSFNQPIVLPNSVVSIGTNFLAGCSSFDSSISLNYGLSTIGSHFLYNCINYNKDLTLPETLTRVDGYFLRECKSMCSILSVGSLPVGIMTKEYNNKYYSLSTSSNDAPMATKGFMIQGVYSLDWTGVFQSINIQSWCRKVYATSPDYNIPTNTLVKANGDEITLTDSDIPSLCNKNSADIVVIDGQDVAIQDIAGVDISELNISSIPLGFLKNAIRLRKVSIPNNITSIDGWFLAFCRTFEDPITIPSGVTSIGAFFLYGCWRFDQPVTIPDSVTSIGNQFLSGCSSFNSAITLGSGVTAIQEGFLANCSSFNQPITIPNSQTTIQRGFLSGCSSFNQPLTIPNGVTRIEADFLSGCLSFNQPITIPNGVTYIGYSFLSSCYAFNQPLSIPDTVGEIGSSFLSWCYKFNQPLNLQNVRKVDASFLYNAKSMISTITINEASAPTTSTDTYLVAEDVTDPMYSTGVTLAGDKAASWIAALPNSDTAPYRKLILAS